MSNIIELRPSLTTCDRCGGGIVDGAEAMTVAVQREQWHGGAACATVEVIQAHSALVFCMPCAELFNFKRIAVGRKKTELDLEREKRAEESLIESAREDTAKALFLNPADVTIQQIKGWLLEKEYEWILAEENRGFAAKDLSLDPAMLTHAQILEWVDANPSKRSKFI